MLPKAAGLLILLTLAALVWVAGQPVRAPAGPAGDPVGIPRTTLDHQGQPAAALPSDAKVAVTGE